MKGRSQRLQSAADPPDDWVDGSWTVDCVCGVNYDDGDEMVTCDECGVWVHTRCSGYVEGDFTCDKCTNNNNNNNNNNDNDNDNDNSCSNFRNDSEETEVAQLLVELPTKTMRMESSYGSNNGIVKRPFRLWTEIPMEERVHVQGVPGGDPGLFNGLPSVFCPQLWKCAGYVPKKFNFQYKEFPCWDEDDKGGDANIENDNENAVDKGAGVLFSLSKNVLTNPVPALVSMRSRDEDNGCCQKASLKEPKKWDPTDGDFRQSHNGVKKERSLLRPVVLHAGKRKKEDLGISKDISGKKKPRTAEKDVDTRKRSLHASKTVLAPTSDARKLEFYEERGVKSFKTDIQSVKNRNMKDTVPAEPVLDDDVAAEKTVASTKKSLHALEHQSEGTSSEFNAKTPALGEDVSGKRSCARVDTSFEDVASIAEHDDAGTKPVSKRNITMEKPDGSHAARVSKLVVEDAPTAGPQIKEKQVVSNTCSDMDVKKDLDEDNSKEALKIESSPIVDASCPEVPPDGTKCVGFLMDVKDSASNLQSVVQKPQDSAQCAEAVTESHINKDDEVLCSKRDCKQEQEGSDGLVPIENTSVSKSNTESAELLLRSAENELPCDPVAQEKTFVSSGNSISSALSFVISKTPSFDDSKHMDLPAPQATKQQITVDCPGTEKKEPTSTLVNDDRRHDVPKKTSKDHSVSSSSSCFKASNSGRISHASVSRRTSLDSKDVGDFSYSKSSSGKNIVVTPGSVESSGTLPSQNASLAQNKVTAAVLPQKGGKISHSNYQSSSKVNNGPQVHPPVVSSSAAVLSDEELALLLHQELNSSPRVPRVPRVRHAGSFPQLASQAATGMLIKRTSSSGVKDQHLVPRKKNKDASKDGSRSSHEVDEEAKKTERVKFSSEKRRQDTVRSGDASKRETNGSAAHVISSRKNNGPVLTTSTNSGPSSSNEVNDHKFLSVHSSPRNFSDEDTGTAGGPVYQTLPSLINEIMSKGRRMTCEELCNAVFPHWPNLRKHNGEPYAYLSHSQAVLDCLRNRQEWAQLIDRGPKTNLSRKRRKIDTEESKDSEDGKHGTEKVESRSVDSQREEFPKGKRNARKCRRLVLQGRRIKDSRNRRKADSFSDEDDDDDGDGAYSNSTEDSIYSEEEIQGGGPQGSEASSSSEDTDDM